MSTRYNLMQDSSVVDQAGNYYPDLATFPYDHLGDLTKGVYAKLSAMNIAYFYLFIYEAYNNFFLYDTLVLWINNIAYLDSDNVDDSIFLPTKDNVSSWYFGELPQ